MGQEDLEPSFKPLTSLAHHHEPVPRLFCKGKDPHCREGKEGRVTKTALDRGPRRLGLFHSWDWDWGSLCFQFPG